MADADSSLTPEQRLLKLIEEQESKESDSGKSAAVQKNEVKGRVFDWKALFSPAFLKAQLIGFGSGFRERVKGGQSKVRLKNVNSILKVSLFLVALLLVINILYDLRLTHNDVVKELKMSQSKMLDMEPVTDSAISTPAVETSEVRNIFQPVTARVEAEKNVSALTVKLLEMTQKLKLTGISINPDNPARTFCMIEDLEKNITIFLKQGDSIAGMRVEEIHPDSIVLRYQDEVIEIR